MTQFSEQIGICQAIRNRKSCRAYLDQDLSLDIIEKILEAARWAPSGVNHQPTQVAVIGKETKSKLAKILIEKHSSGTPPNPDYAYCPKKIGPMFIKIDESNVALLFITLCLSL